MEVQGTNMIGMYVYYTYGRLSPQLRKLNSVIHISNSLAIQKLGYFYTGLVATELTHTRKHN